MENDKELTREVLEGATCCALHRCIDCSANTVCTHSPIEMTATLASALLAEMDKPKVWDGAPDNAHSSMVVWYGKDGSVTHSHDYTRELPKSRARVIAEEFFDSEAYIGFCEIAILKALAEKEAGK